MQLAQATLVRFQMPLDALQYAGLSDAYADGRLHLVYTGSTDRNGQVVWGTVEVTIGPDSALQQLADRRTTRTFYRTVQTISPREAIRIARETGVGEWDGTATVTAVEPSYYFNTDTSFLTPTLRI